MSKFSRKRLKRDRNQTNSDIVTTSSNNGIKRPLDELNSIDAKGFKRRAISATTGTENDDSFIYILDGSEEIKRSTFHNNRPWLMKRPVTLFERSLPTEILYEIFKYLSQSDLFYAFLNLNERFNKILQPFTHHIDCSKLSIEQFEHIRNHLVNAKSLTINNQYAIKQVFRIDLNVHRFPHLEHLTLIDPTIEELNLVFSKLRHVLIRSLNLRIQRPSSSTNETTYKSCLQHHLFSSTPVPSLQSISIEMHNNDYLQFISKTDLPNTLSHLTSLTIPLRSFDSLLFLLEHVPNLTKLCVKLFADQTPLNVPLTGKPPENLLDFELHVTGNELNFDRFVLLLTSRIRASKLERLAYFNRTTTDLNYFNGHRWEIFLENSFPRLKQLQFCFDMPIDEFQTPINPILQSFASFDHQWSIGHIIWRPHSNKTRLKLFTLPYAFDTLKLSTWNSRLFNQRFPPKNFQFVEKLVLDATHGTVKDISQQLIELFHRHCSKTSILQIQNIVLPNQDSFHLTTTAMKKCRNLKHFIVNECDGRLLPMVFSLAPQLTTFTVSGHLLLKYFLKSSTVDSTYLSRIRTLEVNCMQVDRQNRLNRLLTDIPKLFPSLEHLTMDVNSKLSVDLRYIQTILDLLTELTSLKIQRTTKFLLDKIHQDERRVRTFFEIHSLRLHQCDNYEIICKDSQLEFWL